MTAKSGKRVVAAVPDIFFAAKISAVARQLGVEVEFAASREAAVSSARARPDLVIVDLDAASMDAVATVREIKAAAEVRLVAFAGHARGGKMEEAAAAGCDEVLTRGSFSARLPALLA